MKGTPENQKHFSLELTEVEVAFLKGHLLRALENLTLRTFAVSRFVL